MATENKSVSLRGSTRKKATPRKKSTGGDTSPKFDSMAGDVLDGIERQFGITSSRATYGTAISTGILNLDLAMGGGVIGGGWYTFAGVESAGKSTSVTHITAGLVRAGIPTIIHWDAEGSGGDEYAASIYGVDDMGEVYGERDADGVWEKDPKVRYYRSSNLELFFDFCSKMLQNLPDKTYMASSKKWYYVYPPTRDNKSKYKGSYDAKLYKETNRLFIEAEDGKPQAVIILDSYPALLPSGVEEGDDADNSLAFLARAYSKHVPRVAGRLAQKQVTVIGVNQLREKPMVRFGSPFYEGCGNALKFASGCRLWLHTRAVPHGKGQFEEETSVEEEGGVDTYRYTLIKATKNKYATPNMEGWMRIWVTDSLGDGRGIDPVYDCFQYLQRTNQITGGTMNKIRLAFGSYSDEPSRVIRWLDFKRLVLFDKANNVKSLKALCESLKIKPIRIYTLCQKQMASGEGWSLFFEANLEGDKK